MQESQGTVNGPKNCARVDEVILLRLVRSLRYGEDAPDMERTRIRRTVKGKS